MSTNQSSVATEFVAEAFETEVLDETTDRLISRIDDTVSRLREQIDDDRLEKILRADAGSYQLKASMTRDGLQPESFTQEAVINPLLNALGYEYSTEAGGLSGGQTQVADYTISLRDYPAIDSTRLLIEAEPINKDLNSRKHGIGQVRDWLSQREFESDFGFATDGLRWIFVRYDPDSYTLNTIEEIDLQPVFLALFQNQVGKRNDLDEALFDADGERVTRFVRTFEYENFVSIASEARQVIKQKREEITAEFYDDYIRYVFGIVDEDEETPRSLVGDGVVVPDAATEDKARLFAVELMNRLVFIKFLEDKALVQPDLLQTLKDTYKDGFYTGSFYEEFCQPLFYDVMNEKPDSRPAQVQQIDLFQNIPYLNGGLFRPSIGGDDFDEAAFDVRNSVLFSIIDLLERYSFSAEGTPTDLDPSVLGNVFEKTINYVTSDNADTNKELGAYYTPSEITRFCAEETVRPALLDRFEQVLIEECDWPEHAATDYESVYKLIEDLPGKFSTISALLSEVDEFRVVDPACGSGHFLTSVLEEVVTIRKALYARNESYPDEYRLKKTTVLNNIYGVDLMGPAVEIAKLRCWLSVISELETENVDELAEDNALALPNIAFNLREGNSLIGYTGFPETTDNGEYTLGSFSEDTVRDRYQNIIDEIEKHENAFDSETAEKHRRRAFSLLRDAREELIEDIHGEFIEAGIDRISSDQVEQMKPFNWVLEFAEVYADGGFDVVVGNPPWDRIKANRDDFFSRYDSDFRTLSTNQKDIVVADLLEEESIREKWEEYKRTIEIQAQYFNEGEAFTKQRSTVGGRTQASENDLSSLFFERVFEIARDDGYVSQVLPGRIFHGAPTKTLRQHLLTKTRVSSLISFENHGIFDNIDNRYNFGVLTFENQGETDTLRGIFEQKDLDILQSSKESLVDIPIEILTGFAPSSLLFPRIQGPEDLGVLQNAVSFPAVADEQRNWHAKPTRPLGKTSDSERFFDTAEGCDYPILTGRNFFNFNHDPTFYEELKPPFQWSVDENRDPEHSAKQRIREKKMGSLKKSIYQSFGGTGSMKGFVNQLLKNERDSPLSPKDVLLPSTVYRLGFRRVARGTDERTMISAAVPPGPVCDYSFYVIDPFSIKPERGNLSEAPLHGMYEQIFTDGELFVALGLFNSIPFDFLIRRKVDNSIPIYSFKETQVPDLSQGDEWFDYISTRAARLNCYGEDFEEMRNRLGGIEPATGMDERREVQAEIDAAAFHAYGLDHDQTAFVLDDFHRVQNPRIMDEDYFEMVLEKYEDLA
ncbi:Eco57I restriction-modification methylase domain-containing protein [Halobaculum magnesiiphilum]|uniref:site-specific DNA-methyltransferase (adenine-specific) n=1 Tax=Halobaculum magnesiiphilum TaxID=1017351 RepID=A0A8T8WHH6_9EURY|nr:DNA methyltransferase [Halobaculum magnesiiphilum]QZP39194.1 hypothetical protein K6T50_16160 [Halobaculum magnesiiphilum]